MVFYDLEQKEVHVLQKTPQEQAGTVEMLLTMPKQEMITTLTMIMEVNQSNPKI